MVSANGVNIQELRNLYSLDPKVKALFDMHAERERGRLDSTPARQRRVLKEKGVDMSTKELSDLYRKLHKIGVGRCVSGRRGKVSRFLWAFHLKSVAEVAQGKENAALKAAPRPKTKLPKLQPNESTPVSTPTQSTTPVDSQKVTVRKAGLEIEFPMNMTTDDWKDAALFLNSLQAVG